MTEKEILTAVQIIKFGNIIPDEVLYFMKDAALEKLANSDSSIQSTALWLEQQGYVKKGELIKF